MDSIMMGVVGQSFTVLTCKDVTADSRLNPKRREGGEGGGGGGGGGRGGTFEILITTSMPDTTLPKTGCLDSPSGKNENRNMAYCCTCEDEMKDKRKYRLQQGEQKKEEKRKTWREPIQKIIVGNVDEKLRAA
jgi:hypothetical protein